MIYLGVSGNSYSIKYIPWLIGSERKINSLWKVIKKISLIYLEKLLISLNFNFSNT